MQNGWLTGWKEILPYIGVLDIKTARKYVKEYGMPIYRLPGVIKAVPYELDQWLIEFNKLEEMENKSNLPKKD